MSPLSEGSGRPAEAAAPTLGGWRLQPTAVVIRHRQRVAQQCLLIPPHGFAGRARMAVIAEGRREEFSRLWEPGDHSALVLDVVIDPGARQATRADLLLETAAQEPGGRSEDRLSGTLRLHRPPLGVQIYLALLLAPPSSSRPPERASSPPGEEEDLRLLKSARRALRRDRLLRAAWPDSWAARIVALGWQDEIRTWCGTGRLELLTGGTCEPPTRAALGLPTLPQTHLLAAGVRAWPGEDLAPGTRQILIPEESLPAPQPESSSGEASGPRPGRPLRLSIGGRWLLAQTYVPGASIDRITAPDQPATLLWFDRIMRRSLRWLSRPSAGRRTVAGGQRAGWARAESRGSRVHSLAFAPLVVATAEQWKAAHKYVTHWNKGHFSPRLVAATPADYFAVVEELEQLNALRLRQAYA